MFCLLAELHHAYSTSGWILNRSVFRPSFLVHSDFAPFTYQDCYFKDELSLLYLYHFERYPLTFE